MVLSPVSLLASFGAAVKPRRWRRSQPLGFAPHGSIRAQIRSGLSYPIGRTRAPTKTGRSFEIKKPRGFWRFSIRSTRDEAETLCFHPHKRKSYLEESKPTSSFVVTIAPA